MENFITEHKVLFIVIVVILALWEVIMKLIAMWKAARNSHKVWYICIALFNTIGILPLIYILINRKKQ